MKKILFILVILFSLNGFAQTDKKVVQISGVIVAGDSLKAMPLVHITVKGANIGTVSDFYGYFSLVAFASDTIEFSSIGYHKNQFILPDNINENSYSIIHIMLEDTVILKEFTIYPWPTIEEFKTAFINLELTEKDKQIAEQNLSKQKLMVAANNVPLEGSTTYKYELQNRYTKMYIGEGFPSIRIFDPIAWSQFIKAWKNGDFKKKENINYLPKE